MNEHTALSGVSVRQENDYDEACSVPQTEQSSTLELDDFSASLK